MTGDWDATLDDLAQRRARHAMGGADKLAPRREAGRLDARSRIGALLDDGSFTEIGALAGAAPADALVAGVGRIDGRPVAVGAEDFTTLGGSIGPAASRKRWRIADIARRERIPLVMLLEGAGHRPPMPGDPGGGGPGDLGAQGSLSGLVPMVCGVMGSSAGHGAITAPLCDFSVMTPDAAIFTAGPPVVKAALGEEVTKAELGGPGVAIASGVVHNVAADDIALLADIRTYLSFFGSSAWERPPSVDTGDTGPRRLDDLLDIVPRDGNAAYDMRLAISALVDGGGFFRSSRTSVHRSCVRSPASAANPSASSPTSRRSSPDRSMSTQRTRPPTSSRCATASTCRSSSSPTTRGCSPVRPRSEPESSGLVRACSPPRPGLRR